jgi:hypothetical protein
MLELVVKLQSKGGVPLSLTYQHGREYNVKLKVFLMAVIGDTEGHDTLCGWYNSPTLQVQRVCFPRNIPTMECDNAFYLWQHVLSDDVHALIQPDDHVGLKAISQHHVCNAFYNPKLIHGMTPGEPLQVVNLGLFKYRLEGFFICVGMNPKCKAPCKILMQSDSIAQQMGRFLSHQSDCRLP